MGESISLYLVVDETNRVIDVNLTDGIYYQEVPKNTNLIEIKESLGINKGNLYWEGRLYIKERNIELENTLLRKQVEALSAELDLHNDILQELILNTYQ